jgi:hypothetical protein
LARLYRACHPTILATEVDGWQHNQTGVSKPGRSTHQAGLPRGVALLDAGYGNNTALRDGITALDLPYAAGICSTTTVWAPGTAPLPAKKKRSGRGRPAKRLRRDRKHRPFPPGQNAGRQDGETHPPMWPGGRAACAEATAHGSPLR